MKLPLFIVAAFIPCIPLQQPQRNGNTLPTSIEKPQQLPAKSTFYIYLLAGQSNMAGRGIIEPQDTMAVQQVLASDQHNEWVYAKEPLHYYEPGRAGLDCGLSFGKKMATLAGPGISIGLVPCAVGGSSIEQWLGDSTFRGVQLYSNLLAKAKAAAGAGIIKGILWHQGESNAGQKSYDHFREKLTQLIIRLRRDLGQPDLPVYAGQIGAFLSSRTNPYAGAVNNDLALLARSLKNFTVINTADLKPKEDSIHFDAASQRLMGERFAEAAFGKLAH